MASLLQSRRLCWAWKFTRLWHPGTYYCENSPGINKLEWIFLPTFPMVSSGTVFLLLKCFSDWLTSPWQTDWGCHRVQLLSPSAVCLKKLFLPIRQLLSCLLQTTFQIRPKCLQKLLSCLPAATNFRPSLFSLSLFLQDPMMARLVVIHYEKAKLYEMQTKSGIQWTWLPTW